MTSEGGIIADGSDTSFRSGADLTQETHISRDIGALSWFTPSVGTNVGYGVAAVDLIRGLMNKEIYVGYNNHSTLVHVSFVQPEWYLGTDRQYRIGYTPWESTVIPEAWIHYMREQDEIWTTSNFCMDVFKEYEVNEKLHMVPHGIDPEIWTINDRILNDEFIFFHMGGPSERKGGQKVVDAFLDLFDGRSDIKLLMKASGVSEARWRRENYYGGNIANHPQVTVITADLNVEDLVKLFHKAHCLVYPTNGEGFGFIPFQGIATGLPTITTNLTATADFAHFSMPLKASWTEGIGLHLGLWAEPDIEDLRIQMQSAVDNWEEHKKKAMHGARILHSTQTWGHIADQIIDILGDKIYERL
jgi:glycosyltransferase involved in cell wall biosynthesis